MPGPGGGNRGGGGGRMGGPGGGPRGGMGGPGGGRPGGMGGHRPPMGGHHRPPMHHGGYGHRPARYGVGCCGPMCLIALGVIALIAVLLF